MKRMAAVALVLLCLGIPARAGTERDPKGDTYRLDVKRVIVRHQQRGSKEFWVIRVETYDAFTNEQLRRNDENSLYSLAIRFETQGGRPCDRNLQAYVVERGDEWEPHARITGGRGDDYRKWDGGETVYGHPRVWRSDERSINFRFRESMLSRKGLTQFGWGLRTISHEDSMTENNLYWDYAPQSPELAWESED